MDVGFSFHPEWSAGYYVAYRAGIQVIQGEIARQFSAAVGWRRGRLFMEVGPLFFNESLSDDSPALLIFGAMIGLE